MIRSRKQLRQHSNDLRWLRDRFHLLAVEQISGRVDDKLTNNLWIGVPHFLDDNIEYAMKLFYG